MSSTAIFGKRKEPHTIIIAQGDRIRHFTVRPWMVAIAASVAAAMAVGYLLATSYLMLRDDILNAAIARQARLQYAYEDRIATLRSQVDRITSYRLLDQQIMESKVTELLNRQSVLASRTDRLTPLLQRAQANGLTPAINEMAPSRVPVPVVDGGDDASGRTTFRLQGPAAAKADQTASASDDVAPMVALSHLGKSLNTLESAQIDQLSALASSAREMRKKMVATARNAGLPLTAPTVDQPATGTGGPFIPPRPDLDDSKEAFDASLDKLNRELVALGQVRGAIRAMPIANPSPGARITSTFGNRRDPLLGRSAFHSGMDLGVPIGTAVLASGSGTVTRAGRNGGYGNMVEIRHANGISTRYAHLSRILVKAGQKVKTGDKIALSGSTGRSTGPHLHYEVREDNKAVNPMTYLKAGARLQQFL